MILKSYYLFNLASLSVKMNGNWNAFVRLSYKRGLLTFKWSEEMLPHILDLKEKYITVDLTIASQCKSSYTWTLYDFLKAS